jgi:hypothetical protein
MATLKTHLTNFILGVTALAAIGAALVMPGQVNAATDTPWPEPPSCSNETGTCSSIEDILAYECFFEEEDAPIKFCDDPFAELMVSETQSLAAPEPDAEPTPTRLATR